MTHQELQWRKIRMEGNSFKAQLAERRRQSLALLRACPQLAHTPVELRAPHEVCGCLLWHKVRYGYRCLYCMPPLDLPVEVEHLVEGCASLVCAAQGNMNAG